VRAHRRSILVALLAVPWALWAITRTFGLDDRHPLVSLMAFTPYAAATAIVPVAVALVTRRWAIAAVAAVALAALVVAVAPRALHGPQLAAAAPPDRRLVVMSTNLKLGEANADSVMALVRRYHVDVLSLVELSPAAVTRLDAAGARRLLPGRVLAPGIYARGLGLMARRPLTAVEPTAPVDGRLEVALTLPGGRRLRLVAVHPIPPTSSQKAQVWRGQLRDLPGPDDGGVPNLLLGDFNGTLDNRALRDVLDRGYVDAADATGAGLRPTFPVGPLFAPITIDHVFLPHAIDVHRLTVHEIRDSDHRALVAELVLPPG
jgi:endonuclease/exonuclease/phosphatase (EEP) superfamily protein YafD